MIYMLILLNITIIVTPFVFTWLFVRGCVARFERRDPTSPPAPARGPEPTVTWKMKFHRSWPVWSGVILYKEFPVSSYTQEVYAVWALEMQEMAGTGWSPDGIPRPVPPEVVRCSD